MSLLSGLAFAATPAASAYSNYLRYLLEQKQQKEAMAQQDAREQARQQQAFEMWKQQQEFRAKQAQDLAAAEQARQAADPIERIKRAQLAASLTGQPVQLLGDILPQIDPNYQPPMPAPGQGVGPSAGGSEILPPNVTIGPARGGRLRDFVDPAHLRPGINPDTPWDGTKPIPNQYFLPQANPAQVRQQKVDEENAKRKQYDATLKQLRTKMDGAVKAGDVGRARTIAGLIDKANQEFPLLGVSGVDEYRMAQERYRKQQTTEAGQTLRQELTRKRLNAPSDGRGRTGGGTTAKEDEKAQNEFDKADIAIKLARDRLTAIQNYVVPPDASPAQRAVAEKEKRIADANYQSAIRKYELAKRRLATRRPQVEPTAPAPSRPQQKSTLDVFYK